MTAVIVSADAAGVLVRFPVARPLEHLRRLREAFPRARPEANWTWFVPGRTAARRVALWIEAERDRGQAEARRARAATSDQEWSEAARP